MLILYYGNLVLLHNGKYFKLCYSDVIMLHDGNTMAS